MRVCSSAFFCIFWGRGALGLALGAHVDGQGAVCSLQDGLCLGGGLWWLGGATGTGGGLWCTSLWRTACCGCRVPVLSHRINVKQLLILKAGNGGALACLLGGGCQCLELLWRQREPSSDGMPGAAPGVANRCVRLVRESPTCVVSMLRRQAFLPLRDVLATTMAEVVATHCNGTLQSLHSVSAMRFRQGRGWWGCSV